jgi:uncharacterized protein YaiI (UPF0178 family)
MQIWVDADACPKVIKEILYRVADKRKIKLVLVANATMWVPSSPYIETLLVGSGSDVADQEIVQRMAPGELVITADIPLAADVIAGGGHALNPRGEFYTEDNIRERLAVRNFMDELRGSGVETGGPAALTQKDRQAFANRLDQFLTQQKRG